jgi:hypothetical protein
VGGSSDGSNDSAVAVRAASRVASERARGVGKKRRSGSLALTALIVVAVLGAMLWAMIALAP